MTGERAPRPNAVEAAVVEVRRAVRAAVAALDPAARTAPPVVACSGGTDSVALLAAAVAIRRPADPPVHAAIVDHGLQDGSADRAERTAELARRLGATAAVHPVQVTGPGGLEAAARHARYAALRAARPHPDSPVLLGHTLDDQAETVLLGLGRGSGARSISGMRPWDPPWLRPLLGIRRAATRAACAAQDLPVWDDPHNDDPRFTRVRLRHEVLPLLEDVLAGGVAEALARTAAQLREDSAALDAIADTVRAAAADGADLLAEPVAAAPPAIRRRIIRAWLLDQGIGGLTEAQLRAAEIVALRSTERAGVSLPGGLELVRGRERLRVAPARWSPVGQAGADPASTSLPPTGVPIEASTEPDR